MEACTEVHLQQPVIMKSSAWKFQYLDFDGSVKTSTAEVREPVEGEFYAFGDLGCGKTCSAVMHWKPIKAALQALTGLDRPIQSYEEIK